MKKINIAILASLITFLPLFSQENHIVSGVVKDTNGELLINAVVSFCDKSDSTRVFPIVCDLNGYFRQILPGGKYHYFISYIGKKYHPAENEIEIHSNDLNLKEINIQLADQELGVVTVKANRPFVSYRGNTAVYNLSSIPAAVGGNLLDGIRHLPGIEVKDDDGLSVYGFYDLSVFVNHQELKLSKEEIKLYLSSMSVEDIESVELIRNPGPEYGQQVDAVLNIITKQKMNDGVNAFLSANVDYRKSISEQIQGRVNINKSITKNYLAYSFSQTRKHETLTTDTGVDSISILPRNMHQLQVGSDVNISSNHVVGLRSVLSFTDEHFENNSYSAIDLSRKSVNVNLYNNLLGTKWRWTTNLDFTGSNNSRDYLSFYTRTNRQDDQYDYIRIRTDYLYRFSSVFSSQIGLNLSRARYNIKSSEKNIHIDYDESTVASYVSLHFRKDNIYANGGLQVNYDQREGRMNDVDLIFLPKILNWRPFFNTGVDISDKHRLSFALSTYNNKPAFRDMLPYVSTSSSFLHRIGNPELINSIRYNMALTYTFLRAAILEVSFSDEKNPIVEYITDRDEQLMLTKTNLDRSRYVRVLVGLPIPIVNIENGVRWIASTYFAYHHQQDKGIIQENAYSKDFTAYYIQHKHTLSLPLDWYMDTQVTYYSPLFLGVYKTEKQWWINFNISKRIDNWKFSLTGYDILNTNIAKGELYGQSQKMFFTKNWYSPKITFGVSLTIGNKSLKTYKNRRNTDNEKRINQNVDEGLSIGGSE